MDELKIIFYILIGLGWFILKNYRKVTQNRPVINNPTQVTVPQPEQKKVVEQAAKTTRQPSDNKKDTVFTNKRKEDPGLPHKLKHILKDTEGKESKIAKPFLIPEKNQQPVVDFNIENKNSEFVLEELKYANEDEFDLKKIDLRKAIIYSEILKRPEY